MAGAVDFVGLVGGEIEGEGEAAFDPVNAFADAVVEAGKDFVGWGDVSALGQLGEGGGVVVLVGLEVAFQKEGVVVVERFEVVTDPVPGLFFGERFSGEMVILEEFLDQNGGGLVAGLAKGGTFRSEAGSGPGK